MTEEQKKGGMAGKHHPKDDNDQTALAWAHSMRKKYPIPEGGQIKVKFPDGPTGGTWGKTKGRFFATLGKKKVGTFDSWGAAKKAIQDELDGRKKKGKKVAKRKASAVVNGAEIAAALASDDAKGVLLAAAESLEKKAEQMSERAAALRDAADTI